VACRCQPGACTTASSCTQVLCASIPVVWIASSTAAPQQGMPCPFTELLAVAKTARQLCPVASSSCVPFQKRGGLLSYSSAQVVPLLWLHAAGVPDMQSWVLLSGWSNCAAPGSCAVACNPVQSCAGVLRVVACRTATCHTPCVLYWSTFSTCAVLHLVTSGMCVGLQAVKPCAGLSIDCFEAVHCTALIMRAVGGLLGIFSGLQSSSLIAAANRDLLAYISVCFVVPCTWSQCLCRPLRADHLYYLQPQLTRLGSQGTCSGRHLG
jgi:hypothetical protein